ncbi:MAG TPA: hypothetical protein VGQ99_17120, partial [Tepidisphaeraceae bacterium]|nr:hypothetical protein [Tepidisphaeraceae bacterium]
ALRGSTEQTLWFTPVLHMGSTSGLPWWDMWDEKNVARMDEVAREHIMAVRDDPRLLGYYSDNELGWWNAALWKSTLEQGAKSGQRQRLIELLLETYSRDWRKLSADFETQDCSSWDELRERGMLYLRPGGGGIRVMRRFLAVLAERYYQLSHDIIRKYDRRALILGDRYPSFYYPEVTVVCRRHVDVVSTNLNAAWNDGSFPRFQLDTLHELTGKPILVSEIYLSAAENRSGNRNTQGTFPVVATQARRADSARNTIESLAPILYVVGVDWFQYADEPTHGRYDGENFNFGLVDIHDRPYEELTGMLGSLDVQRLRAMPRPARLDASAGVPPAPAEPFADFVPVRAMRNWDRQRGFVRAATSAPLADLYICWKPGAIYLGMHAWDCVEKGYYPSGWAPKEDRALWMVSVAGREIVRARIGGGREAIVNKASVRVESIPVATSSAWNTAAMELPANLLGKNAFAAGDTIELECVLLTHARAYRVEWKGSFKLLR